MKHFLVFLIGFAAIQASSKAAVRAEWSGSLARGLNAVADDDSVASEDMASASQSNANPTTVISNNNNINVQTASQADADADAKAKAEANGKQDQHAQIAYAKNHTDAELVVAERHESYTSSVAITPMLGGSYWSGPWRQNISNDYTFGLALEFPINPWFSIETEGSYASYQIAYSNTLRPVGGFGHRFNQYMLGGNGKVYLFHGMFRPYVGAGLDAVYYQGMSRGPYDPNPYTRMLGYNQLIGSGQLLAGMDVGLSQSISVGLRGSWIAPLVNRPLTADTVGAAGPGAGPGFEEAAAINTSFYRVQGTVRIAF